MSEQTNLVPHLNGHASPRVILAPMASNRPASTVVALAALLAGCTRTPPEAPPARAAAADAGVTSRPAVVDAAAAAPDAATKGAAGWPAALPTPALPAPGPIKVTGYPAELRTCLPDPAEHAGFTSDGGELGYCMNGMTTRCELVDRAGKTRFMTSQKNGDAPDPDPAKERAIKDFLAASNLPALGRRDCTLKPPPLAGTWAYPDITLDVVTVAPSFKKGPTPDTDELVSQPLVRIGGAVAGDTPVHPLAYSAPHNKLSPPAKGEIPFHVNELNALVLSPDGQELGIVTHAFCMEWCDSFQVVRMPAARFASLVYNDAGYRAYLKKDLDRAADLFARAAYVDATREMPAYNLACVYARKGDRRAEAALELAVARGGDALRERAAKDDDFDAVRREPWFAKIVRAPVR
jgi:hypothetical protein